MTPEEVLLAKLRRLPDRERERVLARIAQTLDDSRRAPRDAQHDAQHAAAAVDSTWDTVRLDPATLRWVTQDKAIEYDVG